MIDDWLAVSHWPKASANDFIVYSERFRNQRRNDSIVLHVPLLSSSILHGTQKREGSQYARYISYSTLQSGEHGVYRSEGHHGVLKGRRNAALAFPSTPVPLTWIQWLGKTATLISFAITWPGHFWILTRLLFYRSSQSLVNRSVHDTA